MPRSSFRPPVATAVVLASTLGSLLLAAPVASAEPSGPAGASLAVLEAVAPEVLRNSIELKETSADVVEAATATGGVSIPVSSDDPVQLSSRGIDLEIELPVSDATVVSHADGAAVYSEVGGVSTIVSAQADAGVVIVATLADSSAPSRLDYRYPGVTLKLTGEGDAIGYDAAGDIVAFIGTPWAYDAKGVEVSTHYEVTGDTLTQVVDHVGRGYTYPIVADPVSYGGNDLYTNIVRDADSRGTIIRVYPAAVNFSRLSNSTIWEKYQALTPHTYETATMYDQLICHVRNVGRFKMPWNLEPWRPNVGYNATVTALCNP